MQFSRAVATGVTLFAAAILAMATASASARDPAGPSPATIQAATPTPTRTIIQPEPTLSPSPTTTSPSPAPEQVVQDALGDGEYYEVAGDSILISHSAAARVGPVEGVSTPTMIGPAEAETIPEDPTLSDLDITSPVPAEAALEPTEEAARQAAEGSENETQAISTTWQPAGCGTPSTSSSETSDAP